MFVYTYIHDSMHAIYFYLFRFNGTDVVDVVEIYNTQTNQWQTGPPLSCPRSGHASAVSCSPCAAHSAACST